MTDKDKKAMNLKEQLAAFSTYLQFGLNRVKQNFPGQVSFVQENKDRSYEDVAKMIDDGFVAIK
jgi:hypothetical protein